MGLPELQPAPVERLAVPGRIMQEVVQGLPVGSRHEGRQFDQRLVVFARQQQPDQVLAEGQAFLAREQLVEVRTKLVDRLRRRRGGFAWGRHGMSSSGAGTTSTPDSAAGTADSMPHLTNQR